MIDLVGVILKLGQLAGAGHGGAGDHVGRIDLVVARVHVGVQEEVDDGALQPGTQPAVDGETRAGDLGGGVKVQNLQIGADVPVGLGLPAELTGRAPTAHFHVFAVVLADRHAGVGDVGHAHQELLHFRV